MPPLAAHHLVEAATTVPPEQRPCGPLGRRLLGADDPLPTGSARSRLSRRGSRAGTTAWQVIQCELLSPVPTTQWPLPSTSLSARLATPEATLEETDRLWVLFAELDLKAGSDEFLLRLPGSSPKDDRLDFTDPDPWRGTPMSRAQWQTSQRSSASATIRFWSRRARSGSQPGSPADRSTCEQELRRTTRDRPVGRRTHRGPGDRPPGATCTDGSRQLMLHPGQPSCSSCPLQVRCVAGRSDNEISLRGIEHRGRWRRRESRSTSRTRRGRAREPRHGGPAADHWSTLRPESAGTSSSGRSAFSPSTHLGRHGPPRDRPSRSAAGSGS